MGRAIQGRHGVMKTKELGVKKSLKK